MIADKTEGNDYLVALLNTAIVRDILSIISPTIGFESGYINKIPVANAGDKKQEVIQISRHQIALSRADWDSFETSWDFQRHPLI